MSIPKEPRQMMINMMYLVLTALLALNVSAEVLNAFKIVEKGIGSSTEALVSKNNDMMAAFAEQANKDERAAELYAQALQVRELADEAYTHIEQMKKDLTDEIGVKVQGEGDTILAAESDTHKPTAFMINNRRGYELQELINNTKQQMLQYYPAEQREGLSETMPLQANDDDVPNTGAQNRDWVQYNFMEVPAVAALTILTKLQNDVRNAESDLIRYLVNQVTAEVFKLDQLEGMAVSQTPVVTSGSQYEADIFVTASSSESKPVVYVGRFDPQHINEGPDGNFPKEIEDPGKVPLLAGYDTYDEAEGGRIKYAVGASGEGIRTVTGVVMMQNPITQEIKYYPFKNEYQVIQPVAVVSADAMNVFYIGVENPVSVSVPGFPADRVFASLDNGTMSGGNGKYIVKPSTPGDAKVSVSVKTEDGTTKSMGSMPFRVSRVPDPKVMVGNSEGPAISAGQLRAAVGILAMADNFPFKVNYQVRGFEVSLKQANAAQLQTAVNQGPGFSGDVKAILNRAGRGDKVYFENIKVLAPDGTTRTSSLTYTVL